MDRQLKFWAPEVDTLEESMVEISKAVQSIKDTIAIYQHHCDMHEPQADVARELVELEVARFGLQWRNVIRLMYVVNSRNTADYKVAGGPG